MFAMTACGTNASDDSTISSVSPPAQSEAGGGVGGAQEGSGQEDSAPAESENDSGSSYSSSPKSSSSSSKSVSDDDADAPIFVASLPNSVKAEPNQKIVVQLATDPETRWKANVSGTASVGSVSYSGPPSSQPGAPGTSIATVTAPPAGISYINFIRVPKNGGATIETARLEVNVS